MQIMDLSKADRLDFFLTLFTQVAEKHNKPICVNLIMEEFKNVYGGLFSLHTAFRIKHSLAAFLNVNSKVGGMFIKHPKVNRLHTYSLNFNVSKDTVIKSEYYFDLKGEDKTLKVLKVLQTMTTSFKSTYTANAIATYMTNNNIVESNKLKCLTFSIGSILAKECRCNNSRVIKTKVKIGKDYYSSYKLITEV